jgi:Phage integrase family
MAAFEAFGEMELFGKPFSSASLRQRLHLTCQKLGVPAIHPHVLRHTFALWSVNEGGVSLKTAQRMLGHPDCHLAVRRHPPCDQHTPSRASSARADCSVFCTPLTTVAIYRTPLPAVTESTPGFASTCSSA